MKKAKCMKARSIRAGSNPARSRGAGQKGFVPENDKTNKIKVLV